MNHGHKGECKMQGYLSNSETDLFQLSEFLHKSFTI